MPHALIIGGSLGGLFAANLLHRAGWRVFVCERSAAALSGRGAGLVTHPALFAALAAVGVDVDAREPHDASDLGVYVSARRVFARDGSVTCEQAYPQVLASWPRLYELLHHALPANCYRQGAHCVHVETTRTHVTAHFADGNIESADLLIAADGVRSNVRAQFAPQTTPIYAGYIAWRGLVEEEKLSNDTWATLGNTFGFCLPEGEQMLGYPVRVDDRRAYNFVWYRPVDNDTLEQMHTDSNGHVHRAGIAPQSIRSELIRNMRADAAQNLSPAFAEIVQSTEQPFFQAISDLTSDRLVFDRVVLLGDAAFVARPHVGMGVTKAADDAMALVAAIGEGSGDVNGALARYEQQRLLAGNAVVERARQLGAYMQEQLNSNAEKMHARQFRSAEQVARQTAISLA
jgi:2-polyprenyl-6-methoxyphenol hydroxylase-like FAD-dependent oxidoreductase